MNKILEKKRIVVELKRVESARMELELKIEERLDEIERLKEHIQIQIVKEAELTNKLNKEE